MISKLNQFKVRLSSSLYEVAKKINKYHNGFAVVVDELNNCVGVISDADIRRAIISGRVNDKSIKGVYNKDPIYLKKPLKNIDILNLLSSKKYLKLVPKFIPIIDNRKKLKNVISSETLNSSQNINLSPKNISDRNNTILLIGGGGYIGSVLTKYLLDNKKKVVIFDKFIYGSTDIYKFKKNKNLKIISGDTRHIEDLTRAFKGIDVVVHLAELVGDPLCDIDHEKTYEINYLATDLITNLCKSFLVKRYIYISSCSVYGENKNSECLDEKSKINPLSTYAKLKLNCEEAIIKNNKQDLNYTILRLGTVFGSSFRPRFDLVINLFSALAEIKGEINIEGGKQWRPFVHVLDVARAISAVISADEKKIKRQIFNVVGSNSKIADIALKIKKYKKKLKVNRNLEKKDFRNYKVSAKKIEKIVSFVPKYSINYGIKEIINFVKKNKIFNIDSKKYHNFYKSKI